MKNSDKKVLLLGAGRGQLPVFNHCKKYGYKVIVVTPQGNYPLIELADAVEYANVRDKEVVLEIAKQNKVDAVISDQLDIAVTTCAYVAENLGIKGNNYLTALKFSNKAVMRAEAKKIGINVPRNIVISDAEHIENSINSNELEFPLIMKPLDSAASRGIFRIDSIEEILSHFSYTQSFSSNGKDIIIEEFIEGDEYVVEAYTHDYKTTNLMIGSRDYFNVDGTLIPKSTLFIDAESANTHIDKVLKDVNLAIVEGFGLHFGITHGEYIVQKGTGKVYLVEIAARGGGVFISSHLIPYTCGVKADELLVKDALGIYDQKDISVKKGAAAYFCYLLPKGDILSIENKDSVLNIAGVNECFFDNIEIGMTIDAIIDKSSRKGPFIVSGSNKDACLATIEEIKKIFKVKVQSGTEIKDIIW